MYEEDKVVDKNEKIKLLFPQLAETQPNLITEAIEREAMKI